MKVLSASQMKEWDQFSIAEQSIRSIDLMERAAGACFEWLQLNFPDRDFMIFCGRGNNGGDGLALARLLSNAGLLVHTFISASGNNSPDFEENLNRYIQKEHLVEIVPGSQFPLITKNSVVIDCLFGTGLNRALDGTFKNLVKHINASPAIKISIDIPSGMFCDKSSSGNAIIRADYTLSFETYKLAFFLTENLPFLGNIVILPIGLSAAYLETVSTNFHLTTGPMIRKIFKPRERWVHKYTLGHALLFAGSAGMMGASLLACKACMRTGVGLVSLSNPKMDTAALNAYVPEVISTLEKDIKILLHKKKAICFGPGLLVNSENENLLRQLLQESQIPVLIDASGLSILKNINGLKNKMDAPIILTPHAGEFDVLFGTHQNDFDRLQSSIKQAVDTSIYIILKGPHSSVACPDGKVYFNTTGNSGMATAGAGDVLSGIITALLAQGYNAQDACMLGVYLHGLAGDEVSKIISKESLIASDIIDHIGDAFLLLNNET